MLWLAIGRTHLGSLSRTTAKSPLHTIQAPSFSPDTPSSSEGAPSRYPAGPPLLLLRESSLRAFVGGALLLWSAYRVSLLQHLHRIPVSDGFFLMCKPDCSMHQCIQISGQLSYTSTACHLIRLPTTRVQDACPHRWIIYAIVAVLLESSPHLLNGHCGWHYVWQTVLADKRNLHDTVTDGSPS